MKWGFRQAGTETAVMGMNYRNRHVVAALNPRPLVALANNKVATKERLEAQGLPVPASLAVVRACHEIDRAYDALVRSGTAFVLKPARSSRGRGVLLCRRALEREVVRNDGSPLPRPDFAFAMARILHGEYTSGDLDWALLEELIQPDRSWIYPDLPGPPDLRIIVREGEPIMAMARIPTALSAGRANLHCGGLGVGIDLERGWTTHATWHNAAVERHPDTGVQLAGRPVEGFEECLRLSRACHRAVGLGYMGVDIMSDALRGPMVVEVNARPGLTIQVANRRGLRAAVPLCSMPATVPDVVPHLA